MSFTVSVKGTALAFPCEANETVLDAAQRAGFELPYSCRKGVCGTCKGQVASGEVRAYAGDALGAAERAAGNDLKYARKLVVCDSSRIDTLMALPL